MKRLQYIVCAALLTAIPRISMAQQNITSAPRMKISTVVLDPGHGGKDPGAVGCDKKTFEKDIVLSISKLVRKKINSEFPDVKVIMTRDKDVFIPLIDRAETANRNNADIFISIHDNANRKSVPNGFSAHILGESSNKNKDVFANNMDVCRLENSVITLEEDYSVKYSGFDPDDPSSYIIFGLMQNAYYEQSLLFSSFVTAQMARTGVFYDRGISQDNLYVLWRTSMPSVLLECGFMSNAADLKKLKSEAERDKIASAIFEAFKEYKCNYEGVEYTPSKIKESPVAGETEGQAVHEKAREPEPVSGVESVAVDGVIYGLQVLVSSKNVPADDEYFKGYPVKVFKSGHYNKYMVGVSPSLDEVKKFHKENGKKFPDSFIVKIEGENISVVH